jgi:hypothetical protein
MSMAFAIDSRKNVQIWSTWPFRYEANGVAELTVNLSLQTTDVA